MSDSLVYKTERPWPNKRFSIGAIVGHTTTTTVRLWLRTARPGAFTLLWYPGNADQDGDIFNGFKAVPYALGGVPDGVAAREFTVENWDNDSTVVLDMEGLAADTEYCFALHSAAENRIVLGHDRAFGWRTMPEGEVSLSFGFFSCHMPYKKTLFGKTIVQNMDMWDLMSTALHRHKGSDLRFNIAGGDQVYVDGVPTLSIWRYLNKMMRVEGDELLPSEEDMVSWFRDIYRGYWGFGALQTIYSRFPTYMIWDDHELGDGWGSYFRENGIMQGIEALLPSIDDKNITREQGTVLADRMFRAGRRVYAEYQHSHNPDTADGTFDYGFYVADCAFYFLDGRGNRDVSRESHRILGAEQLQRFGEWLEREETREKSFLFVVSAVPVLHLRPSFANASGSVLAEQFDLSDDLRDSWEHNLHDDERGELTELLFRAAAAGNRVCLLSGDVHIAAAFSIRDPEGHVIYQLTSSAITYNVPRPLQFLLGLGVPDDGVTDDGNSFERLALFTQSNFSIIKVNQERKEVVFQLYGPQNLNAIEDGGRAEIPIPHSIAKIPLTFT